MEFTDLSKKGFEEFAATDFRVSNIGDKNDFIDRKTPTTEEIVSQLTKKVDEDTKPLDKEGQELRLRIDKDIAQGNYEDIAKIMATTDSKKLKQIVDKVAHDFAGLETRKYPYLSKDENGDPCLYIRLGTPPHACYFGEHGLAITAKGVEFVDFNKTPWPTPDSNTIELLK